MFTLLFWINLVHPLHTDALLSVRAQERAAYLCTHAWSHEGWIHAFHDLPYTYAGENLAKGFLTPLDAFNALMASPAHRANILNPHYTDIGWGYACGIDVLLFRG